MWYTGIKNENISKDSKTQRFVCELDESRYKYDYHGPSGNLLDRKFEEYTIFSTCSRYDTRGYLLQNLDSLCFYMIGKFW